MSKVIIINNKEKICEILGRFYEFKTQLRLKQECSNSEITGTLSKIDSQNNHLIFSIRDGSVEYQNSGEILFTLTHHDQKVSFKAVLVDIKDKNELMFSFPKDLFL